MTRSWRIVRLGLLATTGLLVADAPRAQTPASPPPSGARVTSPYEISSCLCLEREMATRQSEMTVRRNAYETLAHQIADTQTAIDRDRPRVDVNDPVAVEAFKRRLDELDVLKTRQDQVTLPDYQAAVGTYNERVAQYTNLCSGRILDPAVTEQVRGNLVCRMGQ